MANIATAGGGLSGNSGFSAENAALRYPLDAGKDKQSGYISFQLINNEIGSNRTIETYQESAIRMYIPSGLQISDGVGYSNVDLGAFGSAASKAARDLVGAGGDFGNALTQGLSGSAIRGILGQMVGGLAPEAIGATIGALAGKSALAGAAIGALIDTSTIQSGIAQGQQRAFNPNTKALFERVSIRNFAFLFSMVPTSATEGDMIQSIVKKFRTELYPETDGSFGNYDIFLKYPNRYNIAIYPAGANTDPNHIIKFKPCNLVSVSTSFNNTSNSFYGDGAPVETTVTLNFTEGETLTKNDVRSGF